MATNIVVTDLTNGTIRQDAAGNSYWEGTGIFDVLMAAVNSNIKVEYDNARLQGKDYASVYLGSMQSVISQSMQFLLTEKTSEAQTDLIVTKENELRLNGIKDRAVRSEQLTNAVIKNYVDERTKNHKVATSASNLAVTVGTQPHKITLAQFQSNKAAADTDYVIEQETQLINSVRFNNEIKALDSLADTYGTFGAGGLTLSAEMWQTYFAIVAKLATVPPPTVTTVTKVT